MPALYHGWFENKPDELPHFEQLLATRMDAFFHDAECVRVKVVSTMKEFQFPRERRFLMQRMGDMSQLAGTNAIRWPRARRRG